MAFPLPLTVLWRHRAHTRRRRPRARCRADAAASSKDQYCASATTLSVSLSFSLCPCFSVCLLSARASSGLLMPSPAASSLPSLQTRTTPCRRSARAAEAARRRGRHRPLPRGTRTWVRAPRRAARPARCGGWDEEGPFHVHAVVVGVVVIFLIVMPRTLLGRFSRRCTRPLLLEAESRRVGPAVVE